MTNVLSPEKNQILAVDFSLGFIYAEFMTNLTALLSPPLAILVLALAATSGAQTSGPTVVGTPLPVYAFGGAVSNANLGSVPSPAPNYQWVWGLALGSDGRLYGTTSQWSGVRAQLFSCEPSTGACVTETSAIPYSTENNGRNNMRLVAGGDGRLYVGAWTEGWGGASLYRFDPTTDDLVDLGPTGHGWGVSALTAAPNGLIYLGTEGGGVFEFDPQNPALGYRLLFTHEDPGLWYSWITSLAFGPDGRLYAGTNGTMGAGFGGHLLEYDFSSGVKRDLGEVFAGSNGILALEAGPDGRVYGSTYGAGSAIGGGRVFAYDPSTGNVTLLRDIGPSSQLIAIARGTDGKMYFSDRDTTILTYTPGATAFLSLGSAVADMEVPALVARPDGGVYGGTSRNGKLFSVQRSPLDFTYSDGRIAGQVTDEATGLPLSGVTVSVHSADGSRVESLVTDTTGSYISMTGLSTGTYYARTTNGKGYVNEAWDNVPCPSCNPTRGTAIIVTAGATRTGVDFALAVGGRISGNVRDEATGLPVSSVSVQIYDASGSFATSGTTNAAGDYSAAGLPSGTYYARTTNGKGYVNEAWDNVPCPSCSATSGTPIIVTAGATRTGVDFALAVGGRISGNVRDVATGKGLATISVEIYDASGARITSAITAPGEVGTYTTGALPAGTYFLRTANTLGYYDQVFSGITCVGTCDVTSGTPVRLVAGDLIAGINFALGVTVSDTTAPLIDAHATVETEATSAAGAVVIYSAPATHDDVDGDGTASCTPVSGTVFALGHTQVTCSAQDVAGNHAIDSFFDVFVRDTTPPALALPTGITVDATSPAGAVVTYTASATDIVGGVVAVNCGLSSGSTFSIGTTTVTCSATDGAGNTVGGSFPVLVQAAAAQVANLVALVQNFNLVAGIANSLDAKLQNVLSALGSAQTGSVANVCGQLGAFINETQAQSGKKLTVAQADQLIVAATGIKAAVGCQ
jgi:5-hydroxyisourate hydrolase-like protein (transthyretin family)